MGEHALEHFRVTSGRHKLVGICEIAVVVIGAGRNSRRNPRRKFREIEPPLLARIIAKEFFAEVLSDATEDNILASCDLTFWDANPLKMGGRTDLVKVEPVKRV
jgi:hypothetical protein